MSYSPLKGFTSVFDSTLSNDIQDGLVEFFDWALLEKGNYFNVTKGETSPSGDDYSKLRMSSADAYASGRVWEGFRKNWVWQSGISYSPAPLVGSNHAKPGISGIYINNTFYPTTTSGTYAYVVDHYNGRVIFDSAIPSGSNVQAEFSYKWINVVYANEVPWLREVQNNSMPGTEFLETAKGNWNIPAEARLQLPAIAIEVVPSRSFRGYQLGGGQWVYTDVIFHCLAEDEMTRNRLVDIVSFQNDKTVALFNSNLLNTSGAFPLDYRGVPVSGALRHPDLVRFYPGGDLVLTKSKVQQMISFGSNLYGGIVRATTENIKTNI